MGEITMEDLLMPFEEFEEKNKIIQTRNDIPYEYLGFSPAKYYKEVDMNVEKLASKVDRLFNKLFKKNS